MKKLFTILAFAVCINTNAQVCFTDTNYLVGSNNTTLTCADFNSDGNLDLAVAYYDNGPYVYILFGDGHGGFAVVDTVCAFDPNGPPRQIRSIVSGDFNGDGKADLALAEWYNSTEGFVQILFGDGTGHFPTSDSIAVGPYPLSICSADFNGDGNLDLATANSNSGPNNVSVLLGDGSGHFSLHASVKVGSAPIAITSGDFNGDGKVDLAVANDNGGGPDSVWVLLGDGTGNFGTPSKYLCGSGPYSVCSKDFNGDGFDDLAVANTNSDNVSVLISKGTSGAFFPAVNYAATPAPNYEPFSVVSADFNLDGKPDLAVADHDNTIFILLGTGTGTFGNSTYFPADYGPWTIITSDFNGDGKPDLATANQSSNNVTVLLNCASAGITNFNIEQDYSVYPNPTTGNFIVETKITGKQTALIYDLNGKLVLAQNINDKTNIDASILNNGIYNLVIKSDEGIINKKLVIVK
jgi:hypothetical protein